MNQQKIELLSSSLIISKKELKRIKKTNNDLYNSILKQRCELNIRLVMQKYFNNEELSLEDENIISGYLFFSNPELISSYNGDGPDFFTLNSIYIYGSGNFNEEELEIIKQIDRRIKENKSRKN